MLPFLEGIVWTLQSLEHDFKKLEFYIIILDNDLKLTVYCYRDINVHVYVYPYDPVFC